MGLNPNNFVDIDAEAWDRYIEDKIQASKEWAWVSIFGIICAAIGAILLLSCLPQAIETLNP